MFVVYTVFFNDYVLPEPVVSVVCVCCVCI